MEEKKKEKEDIIEGLFSAIGLEKFGEAIKKSEAFKERFKLVNEEIEERIRSEETTAKPGIERKISIRPRPIATRGIRRERKYVPRVRLKEKEAIVDIAEREKEVMVIAELPGIKENEIGLELKNKTLLIKAGTQRKFVYLPCAVEQEISKKFNNGILEVTLKKK